MILCRSCKRVWPNGSLYCGHCGSTLGCRICDKGHQNPLHAGYCLVCGTRRLSSGAKCYRLRWLVLLLSWTFAILLSAVLAPVLAMLVCVVLGVVTGIGVGCLLLNAMVPGLGTVLAKALAVSGRLLFGLACKAPKVIGGGGGRP